MVLGYPHFLETQDMCRSASTMGVTKKRLNHHQKIQGVICLLFGILGGKMHEWVVLF
jgi:hypothetical protein